MTVDSSPPWKRQRFTGVHLMDLESAKAKLAAAKEKFGRQIRVFETSTGSQNSAEVSNVEEPDDFFEFTAEDYYRLWAIKKEDKYLKTRRIREAEEAARRSKITKAVIRVRFPDNYTLEAMFHPSETIQNLVDLLKKVVTHPELPLYIYTTPPKKQMKDMSLDFYSAGCVPGAIVYFAYDLPKGDDGAGGLGPFLQEEIMSLQGLEFIAEQAKPTQPTPTPVITSPSVVSEQNPHLISPQPCFVFFLYSIGCSSLRFYPECKFCLALMLDRCFPKWPPCPDGTPVDLSSLRS